MNTQAIASPDARADTAPLPASKPDHPLRETLKIFLKNKSAAGGLILLTIILLGTTIGPALYGVDAYEMVWMPLSPPGDGTPLGTDYIGRDILAGILIGGRVTLIVGAASAVMTIVIGILVGAFSGFFGGRVDAALMKFTEFFQVLPSLLLAMVLVTIFSPSIGTIIFAIGIVGWAQVARLTRAEFLRIGNLEYVKAARAAGARDGYLMFRVILPGSLPPIIVSSALVTGASILFEAGLGYLGLGDPNTLSWGMIIGQNQNYLLDAWWTVTCPGIAIFLTVLAISLIGDGINDALNPRARKRA
ncbi:ABC transporter permease [Chachezhania antarctica]|uniref:ABC transporter permease n=1 Tax=Chachezhania antarctica TaxID=2340860 RepID=UPI000EB53C71|nr:ABC transporter permease [Chachezhania antarctica]|tara:strand:+ start:3094 stop:4002 length:909 start_codon:yes stop_codon:yes gene_type:complete